MNVHKFGKKPERVSTRRQPLTVHWAPKMDVCHPPEKMTPVTWKLFAQQQLIVPANSTTTVALRFGVVMSKGMVLASLKQELKYKKCSLLNEIQLESTDDLIITIQNNSDVPVTINKGDAICFIHYI